MRNNKFKRAMGVCLPIALVVPMLAMAHAQEIGGGSSANRFPGITAFDNMATGFRPAVQNQVRIEERVVVRIAPIRPAARSVLQDRSENEDLPRLSEKPRGECLEVENIAGVGLGTQNRLLFLLRDRKLVSAHLDRSCPAREFYSGLYVERSDDGRLCVKRDVIHARSGANCTVDGLYWVVTKAK